MRLFFFAAVAAAGFVPSGFSAAPEPLSPRSGRWAHEVPKQTLTPDPRVSWGRLDNGFRFALLPYQGTPGRVTLQLVVLAGSLDERPDELGIAHYIEHLSFGGSRNFKSEEMVSLFQRLGVEYGSDVNAITTFDHTAFRLDFRENDPALLREGLRLFRDFGDGVSFSPATIEQERRVVLAELRNRQTLDQERQQAAMPLVFRGLAFPGRSPGGDPKLIAKFTRENFLNFYRRNYRPDQMVLVGAGDFDPAAMEKLVRELFGDMVRPQEPIEVRDEGKLDARTLRAGVFRIAGSGAASISADTAFALPVRPDSREARLESMRRQLAMGLFGMRMESQGMEGGGAEAGYEEILGHGSARVTVNVPVQAWDQGVGAIDQLVRYTVERGFDAVDVQELRKRELRLLAHQADLLATMDPGMLCASLTDSIVSHQVFVGPEREVAWRREWLEKFTAADAQQAFRALWPLNGMSFQIAGGVPLELNADKVLQAVQKSRRSGLASFAPKQRSEVAFKLPRFGTPGEVAERKEITAFGARLFRYQNNARLNFVPSRQEPGLVHARIRVGSGLLSMPGNKPALKEFGLNTLLASGSVHFSADQLAAIARERLLEFGFDVSDRDAFTFRGVMAVEELETFLGLVADILREPQFSNAVHAEERVRAGMGRIAGAMGMGDGLRSLTDYLFKGDPRFTSGSALDYIGMGVTDVRRWMQEPLARGYLEATIVGDLSEEAVLSSVSRTIGALPSRAATKTLTEAPKPVKVTARPGFERIEFVGEQNLGLVIGTWPIVEPVHIRDQAALEVLGKILEIRVRTEMREKLGLAYAPAANFESFDGFENFGLMQSTIDCAPNDAERIAPVMQKIADQLATEGVGEGEFIGARGILMSQVRQAFRDNGFLVSSLMRAQERPEELEELSALHAGTMATVTREEVNQWAKKILVAANCRAAAVVPKAFVGIPQGLR